MPAPILKNKQDVHVPLVSNMTSTTTVDSINEGILDNESEGPRAGDMEME